MSLELNKLTHEVNALGANVAERLTDLAARLPVARATLDTIGIADEELQRKVQAALQHRWPGAIPTGEAVNAAFPLPALAGRHTVIAADGSQIYPDRHSLALYYLINIGSIIFRAGSHQAPAVATHPQVFYEDADLYEDDGRQRPSVLIDAERDRRELAELARLAADEAAQAPTVAVLDNGLLLYFSLQVDDKKLIADVLSAYLDQLDRLRDSRAAVAGVVDRPRAASVIRLLYLHTLKLEEIREETLRQLGPFEHITDAMLFSFLKPGERSALFVNASPANLDTYAPRGHKIFLFYLNTGRAGKDAILRVEVPEWVAADSAQLDLVHAALVEQSRVADGFPYVLMRAHELAVVTQRERGHFEQMLMGALMRRGLQPSISQKAQGKAWTGAAKRRYP